MLTRAEFLGQLMRNYDTPVAVSGTHGKTTTTSMISEILLQADTDPTLSVGGILKAINGNIRVGHSGLFVTEACEYTNSFLSFFPKIGIILNIEEDHMDFFKDLDDIRSSFHRFASLLPEDGALIINSGIERWEEITDGLSCRVITFGLDPSSDYSAEQISYDERANASFVLKSAGFADRSLSLGVPGEHNVLNALAAVALADLLHISFDDTRRALHDFHGTNRRFEYKGTVNGITIIDDYAHHPTEISATLTAARNYPHKTLWCVFQPHTYTRTKAFLEEFGHALALADKVILADIYAARETDTLGISSADIQTLVEKEGKECYYFHTFEEIEQFILKKLYQRGSVDNYGRRRCRKYRGKPTCPLTYPHYPHSDRGKLSPIGCGYFLSKFGGFYAGSSRFYTVSTVSTIHRTSAFARLCGKITCFLFHGPCG
mgnify:CR=1 FL=1